MSPKQPHVVRVAHNCLLHNIWQQNWLEFECETKTMKCLYYKKGPPTCRTDKTFVGLSLTLSQFLLLFFSSYVFSYLCVCETNNDCMKLIADIWGDRKVKPKGKQKKKKENKTEQNHEEWTWLLSAQLHVANILCVWYLCDVWCVLCVYYFRIRWRLVWAVAIYEIKRWDREKVYTYYFSLRCTL